MQGDIGVNCGNGECKTAEEGFPYWICECDKGEDGKPGWGQSLPSSPCNIQRVDCDGHWEKGPCMPDCTRTSHYAIHRPAVGTGEECPSKHGDKKTEPCSELVEIPGDSSGTKIAQGSCASCDGDRNCNGHGACEAGIGCVCEGDYEGSNCELKLDSCAKTKCNGHGSCIADGAACNCAFGWEGEDCAKDPCERCKEPNGICDADTQGTCHCNPGYHSSSYEGDGICDITPMTKNCEGHWAEWGACAASCDSERVFTITQQAEEHGNPCTHEAGVKEKKPCEGSACCRMEGDECQNGADFDANACLCVCKSPWGGRYCTMEVKEFEEVTMEAKQFSNAEHNIPQTAMSDKDVDLSYVPDEVHELSEEEAEGLLAKTDSNTESEDMTMVIAGAIAGVALCGGGGFYAYKQSAPADPYAMYGMGADPYAQGGFQPY